MGGMRSPSSCAGGRTRPGRARGASRAVRPAAVAPLALAALALAALAGCSSMPTASAIKAEARGAAPPFSVVALDAGLAERLATAEAASLKAAFGSGGGAPELTIGVGDQVVVTIFEAASGGLFSGDAGSLGSGSKSISLPPQPVARNGTISVPYVGQVKVAGLTPAAVQAKIEAGLKDKAIEPQVLVTLGESASTFVTVAGDVGQPGRIPLNLGGDRLLDVIATAGGSRAPAHDSLVRLTRGGETVTVPLANVVADPAQNIFLRPDDQVYVETDPPTYTAFGATAQNATVPFGADKLTLAEAVGRAGGLTDGRADARGVFVFRFERPETLAAAGAAPNLAVASAAPPGTVPVVYKLDMQDPAGFFAAQRFLMRDNDVLYVSNSPSANLTRIFGIINGTTGTALNTSRAATLVP